MSLRAQRERACAPTRTHHRLDKICAARFGRRKYLRHRRTVNAQSVCDKHIDFGMLAEVSDLRRERVRHQLVIVIEEREKLAVRHFRTDAPRQRMRARSQSDHTNVGPGREPIKHARTDARPVCHDDDGIVVVPRHRAHRVAGALQQLAPGVIAQ